MTTSAAFRAFAGSDAVFTFVSGTTYSINTFVEKDNIIYKAIVNQTSPVFNAAEWQVVNDFRDIRVQFFTPDLADLTGTSATTATTGIFIPIADRTNVLVIEANNVTQGDPDLTGLTGSVFARYQYNAITNAYLRLSTGEGAITGATFTSNYLQLTNRPNIISGITVSAATGLSGGTIILGTDPPSTGFIELAHDNTSSQAVFTGLTGSQFIQGLNFDEFGHVTQVFSGVSSHESIGAASSVDNTGFAYIQDVSLDSNGHVTGLVSSTWSHPDTSSQASASNAGRNYIQSIRLDGAGHLTGLTTTEVPLDGLTGFTICASTRTTVVNGNVISNGQEVTIGHETGFAAASSINSNGVVIQSITMEGSGHPTVLGTINLDNRYHSGSGTTDTVPRYTAARILTGGTIRDNGNFVAISGAPDGSNALKVYGTILATGDITANSDARLKTNIHPIENAMALVLQLNGVRYNRKDFNNKKEIGLIGQNVEQVVPELSNVVNDTYSVNYMKMTALLIEALKEENKQRIQENKELRKEIDNLKKYIK